jgi:hypothetical protein
VHYVLTSAHCIGGASVANGSAAHGTDVLTALPSGTVDEVGYWWRSVYNPQQGDLGIIRMTDAADWRPDPIVYVANTSEYDRKTTNAPTYPIKYVRSMSTLGVGDYLCRTGVKSHTDCGQFVRLRYGSVPATAGAILAEFDGMYNCPGDSGGPVYAHGGAYGITLGAYGRSLGHKTTSYLPSPWPSPTVECRASTLVQPFYYRNAAGQTVDTLAAVNVFLMTTNNGYGTY